jgi:hypothetical protein
MTGNRSFGRDDLEERLLAFDQEVGLLLPEVRYELLLVGGGALVLLGAIDRPTTDLDAVGFHPKLVDVMQRYDINTRATAYESLLPYHRDDRKIRLDIPTTHGTCYAASLEDIVACKLCSPRDQDAEDVRDPGVLASIDWERLSAIAEEMRLNVLNQRQLDEFFASYRSYVKEHGPCAD